MDKVKLKQLIERRVRDEVEYSWIGSKPLEHHAEIEAAVRESRDLLKEYIDAKV